MYVVLFGLRTRVFGLLGLNGFDAPKVGLWGVHVGRSSSTRGARSQESAAVSIVALCVGGFGWLLQGY